MITADFVLFPKRRWCCHSCQTVMRKMNNNTVLETSTRVTVVLEVCRTPSARKQTGYRHWLGGMGGLDKWLRKLQITSKSSQNVSAKWAEQTEGRGRKEEKRKIIGRESSRCVTGCSPATGSRQEHHFQFLNSSQQTLSSSGTSLLFLFVLFFPRLFWLADAPPWLVNLSL